MVGPRYHIDVNSTHGKRWSVALDEFRSGRSICFQGIGFRVNESDEIDVEVQSTWHTENVTEALAIEDLDVAASIFLKLCAESPSFAEIVTGKPVTYVLIDDYGMGAIALFRKKDQQLDWTTGFPKK